MPEEINRKLTDAISDLLFVTEEHPRRSCRDEGRRATVPPLWDGHAAERIADILLRP